MVKAHPAGAKREVESEVEVPAAQMKTAQQNEDYSDAGRRVGSTISGWQVFSSGCEKPNGNEWWGEDSPVTILFRRNGNRIAASEPHVESEPYRRHAFGTRGPARRPRCL